MRPPMSSDSEDDGDYDGFSFGSEFDEVSTIFLSDHLQYFPSTTFKMLNFF